MVGVSLEDVIVHHPELLARFDADDFGLKVLVTILTDPRDNKADNFFCVLEGDLEAGPGTLSGAADGAVGGPGGQTGEGVEREGNLHLKLVSIDCDMSFADPVLVYHRTHPRAGRHYVDVRNILYALPAMDEPVSPRVRAAILSRAAEPSFLVAWLRAVDDKGRSIVDAGLFDDETLDAVGLPLQLVPGTLARMWSKWTVRLCGCGG